MYTNHSFISPLELVDAVVIGLFLAIRVVPFVFVVSLISVFLVVDFLSGVVESLVFLG